MVLVFKTNIQVAQEKKVRALLAEFPEITRVDFDFEDCDNVLRVESQSDLIHEITKELKSDGLYCKELE